LVRAENEQAAQSLEKEIEGFVTSRVPGSVLMDSAGQEMVFQLPSEGKFSGYRLETSKYNYSLH